LRSVASAGDTIATESPTYFGMLQAVEALGLKVLELPTDAKTGLDASSLERALASRAVKACLFSSSFNNPLGCTMPEDKKIALLDLLASHKVPLIEDDIYGDIYFGKERPVPFIALDRHDNTIYCSSFSKTIAPGYRVGWIVSRRHMQNLLAVKFATTLCGPALPQAALADFLASGGYDSHLRRLRRTFEDNLHGMAHAIEKAFPTGTRMSQPAGGFVLWVELPKPVSTRALFYQALENGVCFAPGDVFSSSNRYSNCLRLSCGQILDERMQTGLRTLGALASAAVAELDGDPKPISSKHHRPTIRA
jgi:DNA-binding transcriptional MocR family regulator